MATQQTTQQPTPQPDPNQLPLATPKPVTPKLLQQPNAGGTPKMGDMGTLSQTTTSAAQPQAQLTMAPQPTATTATQPQQPSRVDLANQAIETSAAATDPYYQKALRDAKSSAAAGGQLFSGQLRTSLGDLARNRMLELDTLRQNAITSATNSAIDDAFRTRDQGLAQQQLDLSGELGRGNLGIAQQQADTAQTSALGNLEIARTGQANQANQFQQSLDFQKAQADIDNQYKAGQLSLAQRNQALAELAQQQQNQIATGQLDLARQSQADQVAQAKATLAEQARQFGLSQSQQMQLAQLADATANRQIDINSEAGRQALLVQLAQIMGDKDARIPASFLQTLLQTLGVTQTTPTPTGTGTSGTVPKGPTTTTGPNGSDTGLPMATQNQTAV